jgi:signal transduction histidine kinase
VSATLGLVLVLAFGLGSFVLGWLVGSRRQQHVEQHRLDRLQDQFIATVSHEVRTPLTSINGSLALLTAGLLERQPERAERMLRIAATNADRLVRLVDDLLDVERLGSGRATLDLGDCSPAAVVERATRAMLGVAQQRHIVLLIESAVEPTRQLRADTDRLEQVLRNLIDNALKYSPSDTTVHVRVEASDKDVRFSVRDQGAGIAPDKIALVWERFQQADMSDARPAGGAGLGLAISKGIVEAHGGMIGVDSAGPGGGSTFWFVIPGNQSPSP